MRRPEAVRRCLFLLRDSWCRLGRGLEVQVVAHWHGSRSSQYFWDPRTTVDHISELADMFPRQSALGLNLGLDRPVQPAKLNIAPAEWQESAETVHQM